MNTRFRILLSVKTKISCNVAYYISGNGERRVNIFHKHGCCITIYMSAFYKTYCFAFQKRLFCAVKA
ncbi:hypothetical protein CLI70_10990 [Prevotella intermedia]|nr:hypothetical protein CLI70_10990 [Prevotella intermedia]